MKLLTYIVTLMIAATAAGCAAGGADKASAAGGGLDNSPSVEGRAYLYDHDVESARSAFVAYGDQVGDAVTSVLLLPYSPAATKILTSHLGASAALNAQGDVIWGDQGLAYFVARGVAWEDSNSTAGIRTLIVDRLPWSRRQLESVDGFVSGLNTPVALLADDLVELADELDAISSKLESAIQEPDLETFFLPGEVFHDDALDVTMGRSELSLLRAALKAGEAAILFFAAYDHAWTLERGFGTTVWTPIVEDPTDPDHVEGAEVVDYQVAHLNESLGRAIAVSERLQGAKAATKEALLSVADMLRFGEESSNDTSLRWRGADVTVANQFAEFLTALAESTDGEVELPYTEPAQSADLSAAFSGRTLGPEQNLVKVDRYFDGIGDVTEVVVDEEGVSAFTDGLFDPSFDSEPAPVLTIEDKVSSLIEHVSDDLFMSFEARTSGSF